MKTTKFDVVLFGASSFVGQILAAEFLERHGLKKGLRWALAGRSQAKLEALRDSLGPTAKKLPLLIADAANEVALRAMCKQTKVVVSTVGPYALYGEPLVKVCVETGTDYCDLTGETQFIRRMLDRYEAEAKVSGARIVHSCGFDSVPSDLGVHFLQGQAQARFGAPCVAIQMRVRKLRGGFSGGTIGSVLNVVKEASGNPELRRGLADPYWLCPPSERKRPRQRDLRFARYDPDFKSWTAPFVMSGINTRIVQRSQALTDSSADLRYDEATLTGSGLSGRLKATGMAAGLTGFLVAAAVPPSRWLLQTMVLPGPGAGPSPAAQLSGGYDLRFLGVTKSGKRLRTQVTGERDPGYGSTARILCQAATCLALEVTYQERAGGFWTPATVFGDKLIVRLEKDAGLKFVVLGD